MNKAELLLEKITRYVFEIPEKMTLREWCDKHRVLPKESSAEFGKWETARTPYMLEIYERILDTEVRELVLQFGAQLAKTEILLNIIAWYIHLDPCPMMIVQPTDELAKEFSKERLAPMIRDCEVISKLVKDPQKKGSDNTISHKMFPGGFVALRGSNSPRKLASKPIKILVMDEVDGYSDDAGGEGDPVELAKKRVKTYLDHKIILTSTPKTKGVSKVEREYEDGSQARYYLDCPSCKGDNELLFNKLIYEVKKDDEKKVEFVKMSCEHCGALHSEDEWKVDNQKTGKWIHKFPERKTKLSYKLSALAGVFDTWEGIVNEYLKVKDIEKEYKSFVNTVLGETYEEEVNQKIDYELIYARRERYKAEVPNGVLLLTAGIDIQDDWIAIDIVGHGTNRERWGIEYHVIHKSISDPKGRQELDEFLNKNWVCEDGSNMGIYSWCMDSGGHNTDDVYDYVEERQIFSRAFAIKGMGGENIQGVHKFNPIPKRKLKLLSLGVNALKDEVYSSLKIAEPGAGFQHFPDDIFKGYDLEYFMSLTAEVKQIKERKIVWKKIQKRNEALDCRNYAIAALKVFKKLDLEKLKKAKEEESFKLPEKKIKKVVKKMKIDKRGVEV